MRAAKVTRPEAAPLVQTARGQVIGHHPDAAEAAYREVLAKTPDNPEALNFVAMCELARGDFPAAQEHLEHAIRIDPQESSFRKNLGIVQLARGRAQDAVDTFDDVIAMDPKELSARLHRAAAMERLGNAYDATAGYYRAIATAHEAYQWRTRATTPPALQPVVQHAIHFIQQHRKRIFLDAMQPARDEYGADALRRIEAGLDVYLEQAPAAYPTDQQRCSFFYVPGLSTGALIDPAVLPGIDALIADRDALRAELQRALREPDLVEPYFGSSDLALLRGQGVLDGDAGARLDSCYLYRDGVPEAPMRRACPHSFAAVAALPGQLQVDELGPNVFFALLGAGTHVLPSTGLTNARVSVEIPLQVDGECVRTVAGERVAWRAGGCVAYDGSFAHALWNHGKGACSALVLDLWHPGLTAAERSALPLLFEGISRFHLAAGVEPPFGN